MDINANKEDFELDLNGLKTALKGAENFLDGELLNKIKMVIGNYDDFLKADIESIIVERNMLYDAAIAD